LEKADMKNAQYITKVEQVAEKAVEVPVTPEDLKAPVDSPEDKVEEVKEKKAGRPKKED